MEKNLKFTNEFIEFLDKTGFKDFTEAQEKFIPVLQEGNDVILISPTGSGKTEAAIFPIMDSILREKYSPITCLFITPLRALNRDMLGRLTKYGKMLGINVQVRHSDISQKERNAIRDKPANILITTPESVQILLVSKKIRESLKNLKYVVVDEIHELAQSERGTQLSVTLERLTELAGNFQRIGLSATVGNPEELAKFLNPGKEVSIVKTGLVKAMEFSLIIPEKATEDMAAKMGSDSAYAGAIVKIHDLMEQNTGTLVFVNTRSVAEDIAFRISLCYKDYPVMVHHGSLSREAREEAESKFKKAEIKGLVCTSSLELGIDIGSADLVIQFNSPRQINKLVQRIGRSGHWIEKVSRGAILCGDIIELEEANAIIEQVNNRVLEPVSIIRKSMSSAANQIILRAYEKRKYNALDFFGFLRKSYPFLEITQEEYIEIVEFLSKARKIRYDGTDIMAGAGSLDYFIGNISMIPSEKNYRVIDIVNRKFVGTLDERYVASEIEPGSYFVIKGATWRTVRLDEEKILVEPFRTAALAPKWTGEDIPVLYDVTERVSENRKNHVVENYVEERSAGILREWYQNNLGYTDRVVIETRGNETLIQILLGTKGNFTMTGLISSVLTSITGESVESDYSPYHIYLRTSIRFKPDQLKNIMIGLRGMDIMPMVESNARRSRFFNGVFVYEARKFGIIRKDADISRINMDKIVASYRDTVVYMDTIRKMMDDYMDVGRINTFLSSLDNVEFKVSDNFSNSSESFLSHYSEMMSPLRPTKTIIDSIHERLLSENMTLLCTKCLWTHTDKVRNLNRIRCGNCGTTLVSAISPYQREDMMKEIGKGKITAKEKNALSKSAHLVRERGQDALLALAGRGIGPETASRILSVRYLSVDDLIMEIIKSENDFARNRRFWS